ncbi:MAG: STAS domain-containing protein [bacterium]
MDVTLPALVDLDCASSLREQLLAALAGGDSVTLDCAAVERIDTAGAQVLLAFLADMGAKGSSVRWSEVGPAARASVARLGLTARLALT